MRRSPIAIIGMAFRFPGNLKCESELWSMLSTGQDMVTQIGSERWATDVLVHPNRAEPGRSVSFAAGVLSDVGKFDANFFGISPREATWMDPQQRLLLEMAWEAMENAGIPPSTLAGTACGVYVGISTLDHGMHAMEDLPSLTANTMTGNTLSIAANRLSYVFDLRGPSVSVDTACSSSLVALHHACLGIRSGDCEMAMVGGVNLLLHPSPFIGFSKAHMLSARGRCHAFDATGDGYVRAEGGGVVLLKPLKQAIKDGDTINGVILASGFNTDGRRKSGLTIPSAEAQAELMREVLRQSGLTANDIDYLEAHGTGTPVGDPIEAHAIGEVYGRARTIGKLPIGSVKSNFGHLEPASGIAGLAKVLQILKHRTLAPSLHFETPNPRIDFDALNIEVLTSSRSIKKPRRRMIAGINSFGFGGANAHVLVSGPQQKRPAADTRHAAKPPFFLSARTLPALQAMAEQYSKLLNDAPEHYYDLAYGAALRRDRMACRLAVLPGRDVAHKLMRFSQRATTADVVIEDALPQTGGVAFVYSGNGAQWQGMGQLLMKESPQFAAQLAELDQLMRPLVDFSIVDELRADESSSRLADAMVAQPLLFAIQVALTSLLRERGICPQMTAGHSVGEVAAAWAAGALSLQQAIVVISKRSGAQARTRGQGRMAAAGLSAIAAREMIGQMGLSALQIACVNSSKNITLAGTQADLNKFGAEAGKRGVSFRMLDIDYAFHSRAMDSVEDLFRVSMGIMTAKKCDAAGFVSAISGCEVSGETLNTEYWWRNLREPVQFDAAMESLVQAGCRIFLEIGPQPILQGYMNECLREGNHTARVLPSLRREDDGLESVDATALRVHLLQSVFDATRFFPVKGRDVTLPNYPWQREQFQRAATNEDRGIAGWRRVHPLLGWRIPNAPALWENVIDAAVCPWLTDHQVADSMVFPGSAYVEMALAAALEHFQMARCEIEGIDIWLPLAFDGEHSYTLQFELSPRDGTFSIRSRVRLSNDGWLLHATGRLLELPVSLEAQGRIAAQIDECPQGVPDLEQHTALARRLGLNYGPCFQRHMTGVRGRGSTIQASLVFHDVIVRDMPAYVIHPAVLDICFQSLIDMNRSDIECGKGSLYLPVRVGRLRFYGRAPFEKFRIAVTTKGSREVSADIDLVSASGAVIATLEDCHFRAAAWGRGGLPENAFWRIVPRLAPLPAREAPLALDSPLELAAHACDGLMRAESRWMREQYFNEALPLGEGLAVSVICDVFKSLEAARAAWLQRALNDPDEVSQRLRPYFVWMRGVLEEQRLLTRDGEGTWRIESDLPNIQALWRTVARDYPAMLPELTAVSHLMRVLPAMFLGEKTNESSRDGGDAGVRVAPIYEASLAYAGTELAVSACLERVTSTWPNGRRLRILDLASTSKPLFSLVISVFPENRVDYVFMPFESDVGARAQTVHRHHQAFKIARAASDDFQWLGDEGLPDRFDVVLIRHCLHRFSRPGELLAQIRDKMSPGGMLLAVERSPNLLADLVFGGVANWWAGDADSPHSSLQSAPAWERVVTQAGFADVKTLHEPQVSHHGAGCYVTLAVRPPMAAQAAVRVPESWLLVCGKQVDDRCTSLVHALASNGQRVGVLAQGIASERLQWPIDVMDPDAVGTAVKTAHKALGKIDHVVYWPGYGRDFQGRDDESPQWCESGVLGALHVAQAMLLLERPPRLWLVSVGSGGAGIWPGHPGQAAIWGMGRVIMNEYPAVCCTMIHVDHAIAPVEAMGFLTAELLDPDGEREVFLNCDGRFVPNMIHADAAPREGTAIEPAGRYRLDFQWPGQLRNLLWKTQTQRALGSGEVEVRVAAAGLNFRDVMYLMGLLPEEAIAGGFAGACLGLEFSGVVTRVAADCETFAVGDAVMGFGSSCFASHVVTAASTLTRKPPSWTFEQAATVPVAFFTVYYALMHLAALRPRERVLVHGAAGGVGIAAIQLALHLGAEVYATAGSPEKRDFVRLLGAHHVFDSRSLAFADEIMTQTNGQGVDVVLNSLSGEAIRRSLVVLKPFGRFIELGKRDFYENTPVGLRFFKNNISYFAVDADQIMVSRPELARQIFENLMALFAQRALFALPYTSFSADDVVEAFRTMQQSRHIGKVVVSLDNAPVALTYDVESVSEIRFSKDSTWLVTGGLTGFGRESARWLAGRGVGRLILAGRRGAQTPGAEQLVEELATLGVCAQAVSCDIADPAAVQALLSSLNDSDKPLTGVLHAAMVLDDGLIANLDATRMRQVMAPKIQGAWNLHMLTRRNPLKYFVLFSSIATFVGNPGQANYVAANAAMESLAALRRSMGLPVTCIAWGAIGDVGYLARNQQVQKVLAGRLGAAMLSARDALSAMDYALTSNSAVTGIAHLDWRGLSALPSATLARFDGLRSEAGVAADGGTPGDVLSLLSGKTRDQALETVRAMVIEVVAKVLLVKVERIDPARSLYDLGMDSLMGMELVMSMERQFVLKIPPMMLAERPTVDQVARYIVDRLVRVEGGMTETGSDAEQTLAALAVQHGVDLTAHAVKQFVSDAEALLKLP